MPFRRSGSSRTLSPWPERPSPPLDGDEPKKSSQPIQLLPACSVSRGQGGALVSRLNKIQNNIYRHETCIKARIISFVVGCVSWSQWLLDCNAFVLLVHEYSRVTIRLYRPLPVGSELDY